MLIHAMRSGPSWGALFGAGPELAYAARVSELVRCRVAVWDLLKLCLREGSLDAAIRDEVPNDFAAFFTAHPHIRRIGLNGGKAAASFRKHASGHMPHGAEAVALPSTSPALAVLSLEQKREAWREALTA